MMGSARQGEVDDAVAWGSVHVRAEDIHEKGVDWVLDQIPESARYYITFDADGLFSGIAPGVLAPGFGGLTYYEPPTSCAASPARARSLATTSSRVPSVDVQNLTSQVCARP